jgi:hypothetical protein
MRGLILILAILALGGCSNRVISSRPWFPVGKDAQLYAPIHNGIWIWDDQTCALDATKPMASWPDCADALYLKDTLAFEVTKEDGAWHWSPREEIEPFVIVAGKPYVMQVEGAGSDEKEKAAPATWLYLGAKPKFDAQGRIVALKLWPIACGPLGKKTDGTQASVTTKPFAGLKRAGANCTAASQTSLRHAATASESLSGTPDKVHWVRDLMDGEGPPS